MSGSSRFLYFLLLAAIAAGTFLAFRSRSATRLLYVVALSFPFVMSLPTASAYVREPRYGLFLWPVLALVFVDLGRRVLWRYESDLAPVVAVAVVVAVGSSWSLGAINWYAAHPPKDIEDRDLAPPKTAQLERYLEARGTRYVYADYWLAYALMLNSKESITAVPIFGQRRYQPHLREVYAANSRTYILFSGSRGERDVRTQLERIGLPFRSEKVDHFVVFDLEVPDGSVARDIP